MNRRTLAGLVTVGVIFGSSSEGFGRRTSGNLSAKTLVLAFYKMALTDFKPKEAFAHYASSDFVDHAADVPGGTRDDATAALEGLIAKMPSGRWTIVRSAAEGDLVFLHVRVNPAPGAPEVAIAEIFRVQNHKIVEHWDVVRPAVDKPVNSHSMF